MSDPSQSGFLRRWSRLKQEEQGRSDADVAIPAEDVAEVNGGDNALDATTVAADSVDAPPVLTDADMPPIDSLNADSDYSQFLSQGISDALRRRALRKLFALPEFNIRDGLNDYDDDFTQFVPLGDTITYQMKQWLQQAQEQQVQALQTEPQHDAAATGEPEAARTDALPGEAKDSGRPNTTLAQHVDEEDDDELGVADG